MSKVLVIDDSTFTLQRHKNLFQGLGHEVKTGQSAYEAYKLLDEGQQFDVILLDLIMPEEDGISALKNIKAKYPHQRIIVVSTESEEKRKDEVLELGAVDFIEKPLTNEKAEYILKKCCE
ncbi:MAG: response regulator [Candidatus Omnitrophica bacterium]|nr:response regulator [Candidatus Omnitrophota bacterium]